MAVDTSRSLRARKTQKTAEDEIRSGLYHIPRSTTANDLYVVDRSVVAPIVNDALERMDQARPRNPQTFNSRDIQIPSRRWLAAAVQSSERNIWRVQHGVGFMGLSFADAILTVLGLEHLVCDLPLYPHPKYSRRGWIQRARSAGITRPAAEYDEMMSRRSATLRNGSSSVAAPD